MVLVFLYFALFLIVHLVAKQFKTAGAARLFQLVSCFILLFGIFGFRDITVLNDTSHYYGFYYHKAHLLSYKTEPITTFHMLDKFEYGFQILIHLLVQYVSKNPYTIIIFSSLVITIGELWVIDKHAKDIAKVCFYMLVASLIFTHYCVIRQAFALIFFYVAFGYLEKGKTGKYYLLILLAGMFHYSALVLLVLPVAIRIKPSKRNAAITICAALLLAVFLFEILSLLGLRDHPYYQNAVQKGALSMIGLVDLLFMCAFLALCLWAQKLNQAAPMKPAYFWVFLTAFCVCLLAPVIYPISRINEYLWPFMIFQLLRYINPAAMRQPCGQPNNKANSLLRIMVITLFAIKLIGINTIRPEWLHVDDYQFYDFSKTHHTYNLYPQE
jgi:hypothetical protein